MHKPITEIERLTTYSTRKFNVDQRDRYVEVVRSGLGKELLVYLETDYTPRPQEAVKSPGRQIRLERGVVISACFLTSLSLRIVEADSHDLLQ
jgi:hypothetical protein